MDERHPKHFYWTDAAAHALTATPSLFERRGVHAMRTRALAWVRAYPDEAKALPGWNQQLLADILNTEGRRTRARVLAREVETTA